MAGLIYDSTAYNRLDALLKNQSEEFKKLDDEKTAQKTAIRYTILITVSIVAIGAFAYFANKK